MPDTDTDTDTDRPGPQRIRDIINELTDLGGMLTALHQTRQTRHGAEPAHDTTCRRAGRSHHA